MTKFHINNEGNPGKCSAEKGGCPFGGEENHYKTVDEARSAYESKMSNSTVFVFASVDDLYEGWYDGPSDENDHSFEKYVTQMEENGLVSSELATKALKDFNVKREFTENMRNEFFGNNVDPNNYTLICTQTGTILGARAVVMEDPEDDDFNEEPNEFIDDPKNKAESITMVHNLSKYKNPIVVEPDTETIVSVKNLYAVNHGDDIIDFDEILESREAAEETAHNVGFKLWDI